MRQYLVTRDGNTYSLKKELPPIDCFQCGECCIRYRPMLLDEEITRMTRKRAISKDEFISRYVHVMPDKELLILDNGESQCPFLYWDQESSKSTCFIYQFRPQACRSWAASLSRTECQEGLKRMRSDKSMLLPKDLYSSGNKIKQLYSVLKDIRAGGALRLPK